MSDLKGWWLVDDDRWAERMREMRERTEQARANGDYVKVAIKPSSLPRRRLTVECDPDCFICHGTSVQEDGQGHLMECANLTEKKKRASGD